VGRGRSGSAPHGVIVGPDGAAWVTDGDVRQLLGRPGEVWGAESAADALVRLRPPAPTG
jgi:streptogramin lyase